MQKRLLSIIFAALLVSFSSLYSQEKYDSNQSDVTPEWSPEPDRKSRFGDDKKVKDEDAAKPLPKSTNFLVYGATVGSPGSINFNVGYYYKDIVVRASGGRWNPNWWGWQADLGYSFWKTPMIAHSVSVVIGQFEVDPFSPDLGHGGQNQYPTNVNVPGYEHKNPTYEDTIIRSYIAQQNPNLAAVLEYESRDNRKLHLTQRYIGLTYDILMGNFFLQLGGGIGAGDYKNPQLLIQLGYLFDTR
ncbi:hypothetical protein EHO59_12060 [Leptospira semungkisensis]|uniref:Uncharacterized protein n=1 Tax=Leptospira semungkisensis TaxID=2484985 RepID=A0A4R9FQ53_9LEPT|nr:hypothetical protein [Leptospira semungkisensis]TGK00674.1 hypothetical protein EHO59_12060 [Leptospira semungkisensis]